MRKNIIPTLLLIISLSLTFLTFGCESQGPAEKAGEKVDESVESTKDALDETSDKVTGEGPAEEAGENIDEGLNKKK
jgi:hypothetical protein